MAVSEEASLAYPGWRIVAACFVMAVFTWGFAFYGNAVYLAELRRAHGWSTSLIGGATTLFYLVGAVLVVFVSDAVRRIGPRRMAAGGALLLAAALLAMARVEAPWQLYGAYLLLAPAWAAMSAAAINNILGLWFDHRRGLAVSLALNGASAGGFIVVPLLAPAIAAFGFPAAMTGSAALAALALAPLLWLTIAAPQSPAAAAPAAPRPAAWTRGRALRSLRFWTIAGPFAALLLAQVGFIVHQIEFLRPGMGLELAGFAVGLTSFMAMAGRLALGVVIDRFDRRLASALSALSQAAALTVMIIWSDPVVRLAACAAFGLSVGNLITLPSLIIQREFEPAAFGMLVGLSTAIAQVVYAFGPGAVAALRDLTGGYAVPLAACAAVQVGAALVVLWRGPSRRTPATSAGRA